MGVGLRDPFATLPKVGLLFYHRFWSERPPETGERVRRSGSSQGRPDAKHGGAAKPRWTGLFRGANRQLACQPGGSPRNNWGPPCT